PVIDEGRTAGVVSEDAQNPAGAQPPTYQIDPTPIDGEWTAQVTRFEPLLKATEVAPYPLALVPTGGLAAHSGRTNGTRPVQAFRVTSPGGGPIALGVKPTQPFAFQPGQMRVRFWFQADPKTSVDLYFRTQRGNCLRVRLTGPAEGPPGCLELGDAGANLNDGQWHFLDLDLQARFEALERDRYIHLHVSEVNVLFAALSPCDGQLWGAECNPAGASYAIADFSVPGALATAPAQAVAASGLKLTTLLDQPSIAVIPLNGWSGAVIASAAVKLKNGQTYPVAVPRRAGTTDSPIRQNVNGVDWSLDRLALRYCLSDPADMVELQVDWKWGAKPADHESVQYDATGLPGLPLFNLQGVKLKPLIWLSPSQEAARALPAGQRPVVLTPPPDFRWVDAAPIDVDFGAATPQAGPRTDNGPNENDLPAEPAPANATARAEDPQPKNAMLVREGVDPFTQRRALRVEPRVSGENWGLAIPLTPGQAGMRANSAFNPRGKMFRFPPGVDDGGNGEDAATGMTDRVEFSLARYPLLRIDHRTPFEAPVNLRSWSSTGGYSFTLTDAWAPFTWYLDDPARFLGRDTFVDDGAWRIDLYDWRKVWLKDMQQRANIADNEPLWLQNLQLIDNGWPGARKGMFLTYGRLQAVPAIRPDEFGVRVAEGPALPVGGAGKDPTAGAEAAYANLVLILATTGPGQPVQNWIPLVPDARAGAGAPTRVYAITPEQRGKITNGLNWVYAVDGPAFAAAVAAGGKVTPAYADAFPVIIDAAPPQVADASPAAGTASANTVVRFRLTDDDLVRAATLRFNINGQDVSVTSNGVQYSPADGTVEIDLALVLRGGEALKSKQTISVNLAAAEDYLGNALATPAPVTQFTWDPALKQGPPVLAQWRFGAGDDADALPVQNYRALLHDSGVNNFEMLPGDGAFRGAGTKITLTSDTPAWGEQSLRARMQDGLGEFYTTLYEDPWFVRDRGILTFDYRATPGARLRIEMDLEDRHLPVPVEGPEGMLIADGAWHHVGIDLSAYARACYPQMKYFLARRLRIAEVSPRTMLAGEGVDIDNLDLMATPRSELFLMRWQTPQGDPPLKVFATVNTKNIDTPPQLNILAAASCEVPQPGRDPLFAHVQAVSRNGAASEILHLKIWDLSLPIRRAKELGWLKN
ncbi:MAG TPA: Ig-like domain-containing protein, partial [Planctomycetota bacterium]|nr:Ig-like domain-containing protein [Planctomycetota bacterium]